MSNQTRQVFCAENARGTENEESVTRNRENGRERKKHEKWQKDGKNHFQRLPSLEIQESTGERIVAFNCFLQEMDGYNR